MRKFTNKIGWSDLIKENKKPQWENFKEKNLRKIQTTWEKIFRYEINTWFKIQGHNRFLFDWDRL